MDTQVDRYATIIKQWLDDFVSRRSTVTGVDYQLVTDGTHHQYQVIRTSWDDESFRFTVIFHFTIKPTGKVWLLVNNTDILVTDDLIEMGIPKSDIVIGFLPEYMRPYSGFAVA